MLAFEHDCEITSAKQCGKIDVDLPNDVAYVISNEEVD